MKLSLQLDQSLHTKRLKPIKVCGRPINFNRVLFSDYIIFSSHTTLLNIFTNFCNISRQICSKEKSKIVFSWNTLPYTQQDIAAHLQMPMVNTLRKYLGMPLQTTGKANSLFTPLVDTINNRIRNWQAKLISQAGRITLIKSILSPLSYFLMQTTLLLVRHLISNRKNQSMASFEEILLPKNIFIFLNIFLD